MASELTEEQVRERLGAAYPSSVDWIIEDPDTYPWSLALVGVVWAGDHYEEAPDGE